MKRVEVTYDSWDWESDFVWSGQVNEVLQKLKTTPFVYSEKEVLEFDAEKVSRVLNLRGKLGLGENNEVPPLTLGRADGTSLYTTRDIAYTHLEVLFCPKSHQCYRHGAVAGAVAA